jgi:riboflavin synthase alpha subunit
MNRRSVLLSAIAALVVSAVTLYAHEFQGTVVSATPASITVSVIDETTKKVAPMTFDIGKQTKIQRGTKVVSFADAHIVKGDKVEITIDHELDMHLAMVIKLEVKK